MALLATAVCIGGELLFDFIFDAGVAVAVEGAEGIAASFVEPAATAAAEALVTSEEALPVATETLKAAFGQALPALAKQTTTGVAEVIKKGIKRKAKEGWEDAVSKRRANDEAGEEVESDFEEPESARGSN